jgi:hypothetical protein
VRLPVQLSKTRLEQRPWRLGWTCVACGKRTAFPAPSDLIPAMLEWERAGGVAVSSREVKQFREASADEFETAVREELLP